MRPSRSASSTRVDATPPRFSTSCLSPSCAFCFCAPAFESMEERAPTSVQAASPYSQQEGFYQQHIFLRQPYQDSATYATAPMITIQLFMQQYAAMR